MTASSEARKERKGEILIQDGIQRTIEARLPGHQKVLLWSQPLHRRLREDPASPTKELRSQVIMGDLLTSSDRSYGKERSNIQVNIMGLVSAMENVNRASFEAWLKEHPTVKLTVRDLAKLAASHLADLFETPPLGVHVSAWRMMLALGEKQVWEQLGESVGQTDGKGDPRFLTHISGAPRGTERLYYQPCWPARNNVATFLEEALAPAWLDSTETMLDGKVLGRSQLESLRNEYMQEASRRRRQVRPQAPLASAPGTQTQGEKSGTSITWDGQVNRHYWVREYHSPVGNKDEFPDFVLFINGLPILLVEVKTPEKGSGLEQGMRDFQSKPSYQGAALGLVTDGERATVDAHMAGEKPVWVNYQGNLTDGRSWKRGDKVTHGSHYLFDQLLSRPARTEFFLRHCGAFNENARYMTARSQQYQALAHLARDLEWLDVCASVHKKQGLPAPMLGNRLVQHTQRTGKTLTMVRSIHLAQGYFPELFRMSMLMVGEVDILRQILKDITSDNFGLADQALDVRRAESKRGLEALLQAQTDDMTKSRNLVILANMQKIDSQIDQNDVLPLPDSQNVLIVLDEGHLSQTEKAAKARQHLLPKASNLLFTATPKSAMNEHYGLTQPWHRLDEFGFGVAKDAGIVCPVIYRRHPYSFEGNSARVGTLVDALTPALAGGLSMDKKDLEALIVQVLGGKGSEDEDTGSLEDLVLRAPGLASNAQAVVMARQLAREVRRQIERELIKERLDAIVDQLESYEHSLPRKDEQAVEDDEKVGGLKAERVFRPRALAFARDIQSALDIIQYIRNLNQGKPTSEQNVYRGRRFALDVADFGKDPTASHNTQSTQGTQSAPPQSQAIIPRDFSGVNPGIASEKALKDEMKSMDPARRVDVLLAVGKYTKGYDNDQLSVVALLRNVAEPSLINQIYTRPATKRNGKPSGVCLDLAFGLGNVACWRKSLEMFDQTPDRNQLYEDKDVQELTAKVRLALEMTANALDMGLDDLASLDTFKERFEALNGEGKMEQGRQFIVRARKTASLLRRLPDASLYDDIKRPLRGLRDALLHVQHVFPELTERRARADDDTDGNDESMVIQGGHSPQALGDFIRNALEALANPSLTPIFGTVDTQGGSLLTRILGISMGAAADIAANVSETQTLTRAQEREMLRASERVLDSMLGANSLPHPEGTDEGPGGEGTGEDWDKNTVRRDPRGITALTDAINRTLDRIRDDLNQLDQEGGTPRQAGDVFEPIRSLARTVRQWREMAQAQGGVLESLTYQSLSNTIDARLHAVGRLQARNNPDLESIVQALTTQASDYIVSSFNEWLTRLPSREHDIPAEQLAVNWLDSQGNRKLSDFLLDAKARGDIHGLEADAFNAAMLHCQADLQVVLGGQAPSEEGEDNPLAKALAWALTTDANHQALETLAGEDEGTLAGAGGAEKGKVGA